MGAMKGFSKMFKAMNEAFLDLMHELNVPIYALGKETPGEEQLGGQKHANRYPSVELACRAISVMADYYERQGSLTSDP